MSDAALPVPVPVVIHWTDAMQVCYYLLLCIFKLDERAGGGRCAQTAWGVITLLVCCVVCVRGERTQSL